ncbi:MAG: ATP-dependent Clp protease proteolytic subunit [Terrisporobacter sp.]|uniref:ATP-dependent Clp protease proteolytic subunit n=1 Tax=Terrisporobacter sp. TaxID=1965305 RepID=UPI002A91AC4D|nr:ATP-dependent Clp protease proteolytic subunit [Terrisporobacter sp.]MDY6152197.1 ATP-dependent Clp protease proteolytic subunit [Terrisporobacter sp.]
MSNLIPMVLEKEGNSERSYDLLSKMLKDRIIFLQGEVTDASANLIVSELLFLEGENPTAPITMYINSPGGSVTAGLAIKNTMDYISCPVHTIGMGMCASMAAFLLASGEQGHRYVLPDATVMIHQVLGGFQGQATDISIHAKYTLSLKEKMNKYLSEYTNGKTTYDEMVNLCERDNFLTANQALEIGLIDKIVKSRKKTQ